MKKIRALLYCTKAKPYLYKEITEWSTNPISYGLYTRTMGINTYLNGTIVCECEIDKVTKNDLRFDGLFNKETGLWLREFADYVRNKEYYCLHLSNVKVFDKPKELGDYYCGIPKKMNNLNGGCYVNVSIDKAPQNMMYSIDDEDNHYILISIQPQWLCKILNGEKTIEVRKQVLNCMKGE